MKARWIALGAGGVAVWLLVTFGIVYGVSEWTSNDGPVATQQAVAPFQSECEKLRTDLISAQTEKAAQVILNLMVREGC